MSLSLPEINTAADAVGAGDLSPDEGAAVASPLETERKAFETVELEARVAAPKKRRQ